MLLTVCVLLKLGKIFVVFISDSRRETGGNNEECTERPSQHVYRSMSFTQPRKRIPKVGPVGVTGFISLQTHFVPVYSGLDLTAPAISIQITRWCPLKIVKQFFLSVLQCFSFLFIFQDDKKVEDNDSFYKRRRRTVCSFLEPVNIVQYFKSWNTHTLCRSSCIHSIRDSCCTNCCFGH